MYSYETPSPMILGFLNNPAALGVLMLVVVVLFGGKNIPELMKGLGQGVREFKKGMEHDHEDEETSRIRRAEQEEEARLRVRIEQEVRARMEAEKNQTETPPQPETVKQGAP